MVLRSSPTASEAERRERDGLQIYLDPLFAVFVDEWLEIDLLKNMDSRRSL